MRTATFLPAAALAKVAFAGLYPGITPENHTCALVKPQMSCSSCADPDLVDTCCTETFGGLVLLTQFWTIYTDREELGQVLPKYSWSIHGLWPDFCDGSYTQYCDLSRQYDPVPSPNTTNAKPDGTPVPPYTGEPIENWFEPNGKMDLLAYMNKYWISRGEPNWHLWAHEYSKHATCFSTFQTECYGPKYEKEDDLFEYFETAISYDRTLPTYKWLSDASILPSNKTQYSLSDIHTALATGFDGETPYVGCSGPRFNETEAGKGSLDNGRTEFGEVWYYYHVRGRPQDHNAKKVPADVAGGSLSNCAKAENAVWYYERSKGSEA
jgi:ribonuclease T2